MGERLLCKQEVVGSIPSASTINAWSSMRIEHRAATWRRVGSLTSFIRREEVFKV